MRANTSAAVQWIEETGCWFAGADGKPVRVQGIVRVNNERHARDEQLVKLSRHDPLHERTRGVHLVGVELAVDVSQAEEDLGPDDLLLLVLLVLAQPLRLLEGVAGIDIRIGRGTIA